MRLSSIALSVTGLALVATLSASPILAGESAPRVYAQPAEAPSNAAEREIAGLFDRWNAALASGKPETVAALYAYNGVLLPTVSNHVRVGHAEIEDYFEHFLTYAPKGTINFRQIRMLDDNTAMDSGVYTFALRDQGATRLMQARYSYVYEKINGSWKIMSHHSSAMPEKFDSAVLASAVR